jgi:hypothetical protein
MDGQWAATSSSYPKPGVLRLRGGGGDGGVYPLTHAEMQWMTSANVGRGEGSWTHQWADKASEDALRLDRATLCSASSKPLTQPIVVTDLGLLCNKEELLERLLTKTMPAHLSHVASLRNFAEATLHPNPHYKGDGFKGGQAAEDAEVPFLCPVAGTPLNGRLPFVFIRSSGQVVSERALKAIGGKTCPVTETPCSEEDLVNLNPTEEDRAVLLARQEARRAAAKAKKKSKRPDGSTAAAGHSAASDATSAGVVLCPAMAERPTPGRSAAGSTAHATDAHLPKASSKAAAPAVGGATRTEVKREREWEAAIKEKASSSAVYKSLFLSAEDRKRQQLEENNNFAARGIPMSLSRSTKFTM